jgi:dehydrogenase/reductase SDR family member 12
VPVRRSPRLRRGVDAALEVGLPLSFSRVGYEVRDRLEAWTPVIDLDGADRTIVVTGANSGLGLATARILARTGADVVAVVRSERKGRAAHQQIEAARHGPGRTDVEIADLEDLASVRALADRLASRGRLDVLVHNAGAMFPERALTVDGLERTYQVHVAAPFLLTHLLLEPLRASDDARVVTVTSGGMYAQRLDAALVDSPDRYRPALAYARAKRAQVALTAEWARRIGSDIRFEVVHPGWADTPGVASSLPRFHRLTSPILRSDGQGADTIAWLTLAPLEGPSGRLWHDRRPRSSHRRPGTRAPTGEAQRLWERVSRDVGLDVTRR